MYPRFQSLREVGWREFDRLRRRMEDVVGKEIWQEAERLGRLGERFEKLPGVKGDEEQK